MEGQVRYGVRRDDGQVSGYVFEAWQEASNYAAVLNLDGPDAHVHTYEVFEIPAETV
jgi:hypothetical protein